MGTTYYVNTKTDLYGIYICSKCKSPQLLQFQLLGAGASTWSQKKAKEALDEPSKKLLNALQNFREKPFLLSKKYTGRSFTTGYEVGFGNSSSLCPYCLNSETWQKGEYYAADCTKDPETGVMLVPKCPEDSRMLVFSTSESAVDALNKIIAFKGAQYKQYWAEHSEEAERIKEQIAFLENKVANLEPLKAAAKDKSNHISTQIAEKEAAMKGMSMFSPEKKAAKAELKELNTKLKAQQEADLQEETKLKEEISSLKKQIKEIKIENPGIMNELEKVTAHEELTHIAARLS